MRARAASLREPWSLTSGEELGPGEATRLWISRHVNTGSRPTRIPNHSAVALAADGDVDGEHAGEVRRRGLGEPRAAHTTSVSNLTTRAVAALHRRHQRRMPLLAVRSPRSGSEVDRASATHRGRHCGRWRLSNERATWYHDEQTSTRCSCGCWCLEARRWCHWHHPAVHPFVDRSRQLRHLQVSDRGTGPPDRSSPQQRAHGNAEVHRLPESRRRAGLPASGGAAC